MGRGSMPRKLAWGPERLAGSGREAASSAMPPFTPLLEEKVVHTLRTQ